jgi:hypothetical protein
VRLINIIYPLALISRISTSLQQGTSVTQGIFIEMFITAALVLSVLMLAAEKHQATPFAPVRFEHFSLSYFYSNYCEVLDRHWPDTFLVPSVRVVRLHLLAADSRLRYQICSILYGSIDEYRQIFWACCYHQVQVSKSLGCELLFASTFNYHNNANSTGWAPFSVLFLDHPSTPLSNSKCSTPTYRTVLTLLLVSYRYWTLNPDQATSDERKSPQDPITVAKAIIDTNIPVAVPAEMNLANSSQTRVGLPTDEAREPFLSQGENHV